MNSESTQLQKARWRVADLDCPSCAAGVEMAVAALPGVENAELNYGSATLRVEFAPGADVARVADAVAATSLRMGHSLESSTPGLQVVDQRSALARNLPMISLVSCGAAMLVAAALDLIWKDIIVADIVFVVAAIAGLVVTLPRAWDSLRRRSIDMNILMTIAVFGAIALGDFGEAAMVVFLFALGNTLESRSMRKTRESIRDLMDLAPQIAHVIREETLYDLMAEDVEIGDLILVRPGERVPLDGVVRDGSASVDEAALTGESVPALKSVDDQVFAGSLSVNGALEIEVTAHLEDSTLARIVSLVEEAQSNKAPYESFVDRFSARYTPIVVGIAVLIAVVPPMISTFTAFEVGGFREWIFRALVLLVISCPCALVISTPVSIVSAITAAARNGVLVKGGAFLELAAKVTVLAYDKTGTLTRGRPEVLTVVRLADRDSEEMLRLAAALESRSNHPLAHAVVQASDRMRMREEGLVELPNVESFTETAGAGVEGVVEGHRVVLGSPSHASNASHAPLRPEILEEIIRLEEETNTVLLLVVDGMATGLVAIADQVRSESAELVEQIRSQGVSRQVMLTGDNGRIAAAMAAQVGVDEYHAGLLPQDKSQFMTELKSAGEVVAMVGDGINDAPALALADIGIAMGGVGSDAALQTADVALMADDLSALPKFLALGKRTMAIVRQNVVFSLTVKVAVLLLAVLGYANMWMAVFADTGVALLVILNGMRLLRDPRERTAGDDR